MNLKFLIIFLFLLSIWIIQIESRKVTQAAKKATPAPPPKKDKSWVRSKIDSAKEKYEAGKEKIKTKIEHAKEKYEHAKDKVKSKFSMGSHSDDTKNSFVQKTTTRKPDYQLRTTTRSYGSYGWNSNVQGDSSKLLTTKRTDHQFRTTPRSYGWNSYVHGDSSNSILTSKKSDLQLRTTPRSYGWNSNVQGESSDSILTTKKPLLDRIKEKAKGSEKYVGKAVGWAKKDLGIGVEGPKKPSKILKYGKKAVEWVFKKKSKKTVVSGSSVGGAYSNGYSSDGVGYSGGSYSGGSYSQSYTDNSNSEHSSDLHEKVEFLRSRLESMQRKIQGTWNTSEAGTKYKLFEERKNWNDAQLHCEELGSNLAYLDSESKNNYAKELLESSNITMVWFGLRTEIGSEQTAQSPDQFSNFGNLNGCGVVDRNGTWSISSCSMELPYLCQAFRFDVLVEIPYNK